MEEHLTTNIGVYALVIKDKKLLLLHQPNNPIWCALGGRMNKNDSTPEETLKRETKEEINVEIKVLDILDSKLWDINGKNKRLGLFYVCELENENDINNIKLSEEHNDFKFFTFNEALKMWQQEDRGQTGIELGTKLKEKGYLY